MTNAYDYQFSQFDFEKEYEKMKNRIKKPNILICGATGVGKSTVVNYIFGEELAAVGSGQPVTEGIERYEMDEVDIVLYDSEGYEIGAERQTAFQDNILGLIDSRLDKQMEEQIHLVWYTISAANKRVTDLDLSLIQSLRQRGVAVAILLTQIDSVDASELAALKEVLTEQLPMTKIFTLSIFDLPEEFLQWDELVDWSINSLPEQLREGFIRSLKRSIDQKRTHVIKKIIPKYTTIAAGIAVSPVPMSDAALLMPTQMKMYMEILHLYGVDRIGNNLKAILNGTLLSQLGKRAAAFLTGQVLKYFPGLGTVAGAAINTTVASSFTYAAGMVCLEATYQYSKRIINGESIAFEEIFNMIDIDGLFDLFMKKEERQA